MKLTVILAALVGLVVGSAATAATPWKVFATATDSGEYSAYANASASVQNPNGLGIRVKGTGGPFEVTWFASCEGVVRPPAGKVIVIGVPQAAKCSVNAGAITSKGGSVRVELLRR